MKAEIIAIGTELLLGQIANTNAQFISEQLAALGIPVYFHTVVGDNPTRLRAQLEISTKRSDILIFTGGLGPTKDDLTKDTIASFIHRSLVVDEEGLEQVVSFFRKRNVPMTDNNIKQAMVIEGATVFPNKTGLALGMAVHNEGKHYLLFPGPPNELKPMFIHYAVPYLRQIVPEANVVYSKVMRFCGIGESALEKELEDLIDAQENPTIAPLAKQGEVTIRLTSFAKNKEEAEQSMQDTIKEITSRVGEYLYGWDDDTLESVACSLLKKRKWTLAAAESCTGGLFSHSICTISGASEVFKGSVVCYTNEIKEEIVGVPKSVLLKEGAVSSSTACFLAQGVKERFHSDVGLSITGVAGPATQEGKPVGLVYIGMHLPSGEVVKELRLAGDRNSIQVRASKLALFYLIKELQKG